MRCWIVLLLIPGCADEHESDGIESGGMRGQAISADSGADAAASTENSDPQGTSAAIAVIREYYEAINRGDYEQAYAHWDNNGAASGQSFAEFRSGYLSTTSVNLVTGEPGRIEGAAGSRYIAIPVSLSAQTTDAVAQCFTGTYTLVRSVVPGATERQRLWQIHSADLKRCEPGASDAPADAAGAVTALVQRLGEHLSRVSLLAPVSDLREQIRSEYAPLVTTSLLEAWLAAPSTAPGRSVSSPWPDRIEIDRVRRLRVDAYEVTGDVVYVTSVDMTRGGAGRREPVVVTVRRGEDGSWRIAAFREGT